MDNTRFLELLRADGTRLVDVAARDLDAAVPPCPGWTVREAVRHTAEVYRHKIAILRLGRPPGEGEYEENPPAGVDVLDWFRSGHAELLAELAGHSPEKQAWSWFPPDQTVGFWYRRMAQETAVHRVDVESAFDAITPVDDELAVDGVDEVMLRFLVEPWGPEPAPDAAGERILVRTGDHAWLARLQPDRVEVTTELGPYDAVLTGEPSELLLYLWGRRPLRAVRAEGDAAALAALRERLAVATE